jgi:predicted transcriptional regulator
MREGLMAVTTVRLPDELDARLAAYCERTGAVKNRVMALALGEYLPDADAAPLPAREAAFLEELRAELDAREVNP